MSDWLKELFIDEAKAALNSHSNGDISIFWQLYQQCGNRNDYDYAFAGRGWTPDLFKPIYEIKGSAHSAFRYSRLNTIDIPIIIEDSGNYCFAYSTVETIANLDLSNLKSSQYMFQYTQKLKSITFAKNSVIPISIDLSVCPLSDETVTSIINHLKDLRGATGQTLTLKADVGARVTQEQIDAIDAKNWTLVY